MMMNFKFRNFLCFPILLLFHSSLPPLVFFSLLVSFLASSSFDDWNLRSFE